MARIITETVSITLSRLVKDSDQPADSLVSEEVLSALEQVSQELVGSGVIVEASVQS